MFNKILIANRGEIACRVMKTAKAMGIRCVAVYSTIDAEALHVQLADEAYLLGDAPSQDSYLCIDKIIAIAKQSGCEAIHPGYGFLSENAEFANTCQKEKIVFIGPSPEAIDSMGNKSKAKEIMSKAGIPCIPGYHGDNQDSDFLLKEAEKIGFPVLIKATQGGGGKGMRKVGAAKQFKEALASAQREAKASFGDSHVLLEKYLEHPRHIEIQVMADNKDNVVYLFERDCSIQRRHQKIIEEAPAIGISATLREKMGKAAVDAAKAIHYRGAGTLEFLVDIHGNFYFMEMNTRLQVEHPVTEMITDLDLVAWQLNIAAGLPLPCQQKDLAIHGHAIEVRLYAEDPQNDFLPATGTIHYLSWPNADCARIDSGIRAKDSISSYYDPMIAKLIVHGNSRDDAILKLKIALAQLHILGVKTNRTFLQTITSLPDYIKGKLNTHFIAEHETELQPTVPADIKVLLCSAAIYSSETIVLKDSMSEDVFSPWHQADGFRLQLAYQRSLYFEFNQKVHDVTVNYQQASIGSITIGDTQYSINYERHDENNWTITIDTVSYPMTIIKQDTQLWIIHNDNEYMLQSVKTQHEEADMESTLHLNAPMPGAIIAVNVRAGDTVKKDDCLIVMEAMKMEHSIYAPHAGKVREVFYAPGDRVDEGAELLTFE